MASTAFWKPVAGSAAGGGWRGCARIATRHPSAGAQLQRHCWRAVLSLLLLPLLSGCLLASGEETTIDLQEGTGNLSSSFVSGEGQEARQVQVGDGPVELQVIAIVAVESGDLQLELIQPDGAVAFVVAGRPDAQVTRSGLVRSDDQGAIRYRVTARGARSGAYQLFFQP